MATSVAILDYVEELLVMGVHPKFCLQMCAWNVRIMMIRPHRPG